MATGVVITVACLDGNTNVTLGKGTNVAVGDKVAVIVMGIAVGSVGAMRSDVGGISSVAVGSGSNVLVIRVELVAVAVTVGVIVAVTVISWVGVEDPLCKTRLGLLSANSPDDKKALQSPPEP